MWTRNFDRKAMGRIRGNKPPEKENLRAKCGLSWKSFCSESVLICANIRSLFSQGVRSEGQACERAK